MPSKRQRVNPAANEKKSHKKSRFSPVAEIVKCKQNLCQVKSCLPPVAEKTQRQENQCQKVSRSRSEAESVKSGGKNPQKKSRFPPVAEKVKINQSKREPPSECSEKAAACQSQVTLKSIPKWRLPHNMYLFRHKKKKRQPLREIAVKMTGEKQVPVIIIKCNCADFPLFP